jgi:WW domain-binding protein 2
LKIVYLPSSPTPELQSFSSPILKLQDTHVRAPFFGANYWTASCVPTANGGIPPSHSLVELRLTFREGGAFDFHTIFEQIKERLYQAYTVARESGQRGANVDLANVHLEQLPAYEPAREVEREEEERVILSPIPVRPGEARDSGVAGVRSLNDESPKPEERGTPDEPPPGYEETQAQAVGAELEQRLRAEAERS